VVSSKISIANGVPLTLSPEVAVSRALWPGCSDRSLELKLTLGWALATESVEAGTLGRTGRLSVPNLLRVLDDSTSGNTVSLQDAGVVGPAFTGSMGHKALPTGTEATPGASRAGVTEWQVTWGPELLGACGKLGLRCLVRGRRRRGQLALVAKRRAETRADAARPAITGLRLNAGDSDRGRPGESDQAELAACDQPGERESRLRPRSHDRPEPV